MDKETLMIFKAFEDRIRNLEKKFDTPTVRHEGGIAENSEGLIDVAALADENGTSIEELAEMLSDHEDRIAALEEGNDGK